MQITKNDLVKFLLNKPSFNSFIAFLKGNYFEIDDPKKISKNILNQCYDVFYAYCLFLGVDYTKCRMKSAYMLYDNYEKNKTLQKYFKKIKNTPEFIIKKGDVVLWKIGEDGHVAIENEDGKDTKHFTVLSQNDPIPNSKTNPNGTPCIIKTYNYKNVLGVLRPKTKIPTPSDQKNYTEIEKRGIELWGFRK